MITIMDIIYHVVIWYIQIRSILGFWGGTWWWKTIDSIVCRETTNSMQKSSFQKIYISLSIDWFINRFILLLLLSHFSHVQLFVTPWTVVHQDPLSIGFSRQEYWSGFAMLSSRGSSWPRDRTCVSMPPALAGRLYKTSTTQETQLIYS